MSGPLYKFYTNGRNFFKLDSNVHPNWVMCRTHLTLVSALSRGYESHSAIFLFNVSTDFEMKSDELEIAEKLDKSNIASARN